VRNEKLMLLSVFIAHSVDLDEMLILRFLILRNLNFIILASSANKISKLRILKQKSSGTEKFKKG
jgi:hypothetical protein